jgi:hypothetical protein
MHIISLDASKAFDKLWRAGLFFKMIGKLDPPLWRILYNYYSISKIIVRFNNEKSGVIKISEGVKQGGILSPFLFNFYIDDLLRSCLNKELGAVIGDKNLSILGYCDDLILMSPITKHMEILLNMCVKYASKWKINFNSKKSVYLQVGPDFEEKSFEINGNTLKKVDNFIYLGLPIDKSPNKTKYFDEKFKKVERSFYSLYGLGCKPKHLSPRSIGFVYKQFCQSIFRYGLECIHLPSYKINEYNTRQNNMIKQAIGLSKFAVSTPLLNALRVEKISEVYLKQKIYFFKQIMLNNLTKTVYDSLKHIYSSKITPKESFCNQIRIVNSQTNFSISIERYKESLIAISKIFLCEQELCDRVSSLLDEMDSNKKDEIEWSNSRQALSILLYN